MSNTVKTVGELHSILERINHRSYPAYKDAKGSYDFKDFELKIEHVQSDPFASPSSLKIIVYKPDFPDDYIRFRYMKTAMEDWILRNLHSAFKKASAGSSKKTARLSISRPVQEIMERTAVRFLENGSLSIEFQCSFPAEGRKIVSNSLTELLCVKLPEIIRKLCIYANYSARQKEEAADVLRLALHQHEIRLQLEQKNLAAFVKNGSILPRQSGNSDLPMKEAVEFQSPKSMEVTMVMEDGTRYMGMGIPEGITLITGGGYHGKSTLLEALEAGIYNHIQNDGREFVLTREDAVKIRAEDGRSVHEEDISWFIQNLPFGRDTARFVSEDASGSTSQAAATIEALESGSRLLLIDEDTSATNFMIRDDLMASVISSQKEPIVPFISRAVDLKKDGISTILVAGSSGAFFKVADQVLMMDEYQPFDITREAKLAADAHCVSIAQAPLRNPLPKRIPQVNEAASAQRVKVKAGGLDTVSINREPIDIRYLEQLKDSEQAYSIGRMLLYAQQNLIDNQKSMEQVLDDLESLMDEDLSVFGRGISRVRRQELEAAFSRWRSMHFRIEPEKADTEK